MTTRYYKTDSPAAWAEWRAYCEARHQLVEAATACARQFGATSAKFLPSPLRFAGLHFQDKPDPAHWTAHDYNGCSRPRSRPCPSTTATRAAHAALREAWDATVPTIQASTDRVMAALGLPDPLAIVLYGGANLFERDGWLYIALAMPAPQLTEILGSEYERAKNAKPARPPVEPRQLTPSVR